MRNESLKDRVVVITGASSGFGKGAALAFAAEGARVVLAARRADLLEELARQCDAAGGEAIPVVTDVSNWENVAELTEAALSEFGRIDVWINNAGVGAIGPFEDIPLEDHIQVIETDLLGTLYGAYFAYREFINQGSGILINISSELGRHGVPYYTSYAAAKHGVVGLGDALRQEIAETDRDGIHVCTVLPTAHDTPFFDHAANYTGREIQAPEPLHDPHDVVQTLVALARNPKDNKIVGGDGVVKIMMKSFAPTLVEKMGAKQMHKTQMEEAPPAGNTPGAVRYPVKNGTQIQAGRLFLSDARFARK